MSNSNRISLRSDAPRRHVFMSGFASGFTALGFLMSNPRPTHIRVPTVVDAWRQVGNTMGYVIQLETAREKAKAEAKASRAGKQAVRK